MSVPSLIAPATFLACLALFAVLGTLASRRARAGDTDYLLAGRDTSPVLVALSAAATKYSGYMFIALMGYIYTHGLSAIWLVLGFLFGDLLAFSRIHRQVHQATRDTGATTFPDLLARWGGGDRRVLRVAVALLILVFLATYAAAQFSAGGKALEVLFGWPGVAGAVLGAAVVLAYSVSGGLRASIWTDAAQAILMLGAMLLLLAVSIRATGGFGGFLSALDGVSPRHLDLGQDRFGGIAAMLLFGFGWLFNGLGVVGQPQVMVRFMALAPKADTRMVAIPYFAWTLLFVTSAFMVGLATPVFLGADTSFDPELALPSLAAELVPGLAVGVVIGGIFASSMSTADSQVLVCSAALSDDLALMKGQGGRRWATVLVIAVALAIALFASANVFQLVIFAWSALACGLGPLVIVYAYGQKPSELGALAMIGAGLLTALMWRELGFNAWLYEGLPGMVAGFLVFGCERLIRVLVPQP